MNSFYLVYIVWDIIFISIPRFFLIKKLTYKKIIDNQPLDFLLPSNLFSWLQHCSFNVTTSIVIDFLIKKLKICYYFGNDTVLRYIYTMYHGSTRQISNYTINTVGVIQWVQKCIHIKTFLYQNELLSSLMLMQYIQLIQKESLD